MRGWAATSIGAIAVFAIAEACTGSDPDLEGSTDGGSQPDANNNGADVGPGDANAVDTGAADAAPDTWCSSHGDHQFCADFDRDPYDFDWARQEHRGLVSPEVTTFVSAPRAAQANVDPGDGGSPFDPLVGAIGHALTATPGTAEASFSMLMRKPPADLDTGQSITLAIVAAGDTNAAFLQLYTQSPGNFVFGFYLNRGDHFVPVDSSAVPTFYAWIEYGIRVVYRADATGEASLTVAGKVVATTTGIITYGAPSPTVVLGLGTTVYGASPGMKAAYDNVLFDNH